MKKFMSLFLVFCICLGFSTMSFAESKSDVVDGAAYQYAEKLLSDLGIYEGVEAYTAADGFVKKDVFAILTTRLMNIEAVTEGSNFGLLDLKADDFAANEIFTLMRMGIFDVPSGGYFKPDNFITYKEAAKALVQVLGYDVAVTEKTYDGYYAQAHRLGIMRNVSLSKDERLQVKQLTMMLYNTLFIDSMGAVFTGAGQEFSIAKGHTLLSDTFNLAKIDGVVTANSITNLSFEAELPVGKVMIGGIVYHAGQTNAEDLLGYKVRAYYDKDTETLISVDSTVHTTEFELNVENLTYRFLTYLYEVNDREVKANISSQADIIYNHEAMVFDENLMVPNEGKVLLLDHDSDKIYDTVNNDDNIADIEELQLEIKRAYFTDCLNRVVAQDYNTAKNILFPASISDEENEDDVFKIKSFTYYTQYKDLEAKSKDSEILDKLIEKEGGLTSYSDVHKTLSDATLTLAMNETEFWNQIQNIVNTNDDYFTLEDIPAQVWKDVWDLRPFSDITDFELKCNDLNAILPTPTPTPTLAPVVGGGGESPVVGRPTTVTDEKAPENFDKTENNTEPVVNVIFTDVPKNHWANTAIEYLYQEGIINGVGENRFNPDATLKREELIKMLVVATGNTPTGSESSFLDVDPNQWYAGYIATAKALGITNGKDNGSFGVGESLTREDAAVLCYRALGNKISQTANDLSFTDHEMISDYAKEAVANMVELGIINGKGDGTFAPKDYCTRAEISKILYGVLEGASK